MLARRGLQKDEFRLQSKKGSLLFSAGELESEKLYVPVPSVVNRYALTQPQRHRGTENKKRSGNVLPERGKKLCVSVPLWFRPSVGNR